MVKLTEHFKLEEFIFSDYALRNGIDNTPPPVIIENLIILCQHTLEPIRLLVNRPVHIISGYRNVLVNEGIGGSSNSQHLLGRAADVRIYGYTPNELCTLILNNSIPFDQLINEFDSWTHISYSEVYNRKEHFKITNDEFGRRKVIRT
jgi:hypothetical protein